MLGWVWRGLRTGVLTTSYPARPAAMPDGYRGRPRISQALLDEQMIVSLIAVCPTGAFLRSPHGLQLDLGRCVQCGLCAAIAPAAVTMTPDFELAVRQRLDLVLEASEQPQETTIPVLRAGIATRIRDLRRSVHIRHIDTGSDGAIEQEIHALTNPYYDIQRLGLFFTPSPRHADILLVTGSLTDAMVEPLRRTYTAMPSPKLVIAAGTDACGGGFFQQSDVTDRGVAAVLPVDVFIPGDPPPPLALLYGLLVALGRLDQQLPQQPSPKLPANPLLGAMTLASGNSNER
ncbi:MAG: NADH:ubiquinone oxidoreductase [Chloroflexi bacterium]|nr:NADH:ubiquinone oxidoreductase [Chloroflexota bacterium]